MSAGAALARKCSLSRRLVCPVDLGRVFAIGAVSGAGPLPRPCCCCGRGAGLPPPAGAFGAGVLSPGLAMSVLTLVDGFAAPLAGADFAAVGQRLHARPRGLVAARADRQHVGQRQRALALDDAALPQLLGWPLVLLRHVDVLDHHPALLGQHAQHLAALAALAPGDDADQVAPSHVDRLHQMTSGASEMILVNCRSRSSRATGPKMRVPTGFSSGLISTTALRSKRM